MGLLFKDLAQRRAAFPPAGCDRLVWREEFDNPTLASYFRTNGPHDFATGYGIWTPGNEFVNGDARGNAGSAGCWALNPLNYAWTGGFTPFAVANSVMTLRSGMAATAGIDAQMPYRPIATFTASISGTTMTVTALINGERINVGATVSGASTTGGTTIVAQLTGVGGLTGTYQVSASQTRASADLTATGPRYKQYSAAISTIDSVRWRGEHYAEAMIKPPGEYGAWWAYWFWSKALHPLWDPHYGSFEIDIDEHTPIYPAVQHTNLHWDEDRLPGGTYQGPNTGTLVGGVQGNQWRKIGVHRKLNEVIWYLNDVEIRRNAKPAAAVTWDDWMHCRLNLDMGDHTFDQFPGEWDGTPDPVEAQVDYVRLYLPADKISQNFFYSNSPSGFGANRINGYPNTSGWEPCFWGDITGGLTADGPVYNGVTSARISSGGADWHRRVCYGHSTTTNAHGEGGTTPAFGGAVNGVVYRVQIRFNYGTSAKGALWIGASGGTESIGTFAGTTYTHGSGPAFANTSLTSGVAHAGEYLLQFDWTADATAEMASAYGPNSNVLGEYVDLIEVRIEPYI